MHVLEHWFSLKIASTIMKLLAPATLVENMQSVSALWYLEWAESQQHKLRSPDATILASPASAAMADAHMRLTAHAIDDFTATSISSFQCLVCHTMIHIIAVTLEKQSSYERRKQKD